MITINKKLKGFLPYSLVWFPNEATLREMAAGLPLTHLAHVNCAAEDLPDGGSIVDHHVSMTFSLNLSRPIGEIFAGLSGTARTKIRRGEKLSSRINIRRYRGGAENAGYVDEYVELFNQLAQKKVGLLQPITSDLARSYFPHAEIDLLDYDGELMCGHLWMVDPEAGKIRMHYSASRRLESPELSRLAGILNLHLHWFEIQAFKEASFNEYDFGGVSLVDDWGINRFKLQFGARIIREHGYLMAGAPHLWRLAFGLFASLTARGRRRRTLERAGDHWRHMPLERIEQIVRASQGLEALKAAPDANLIVANSQTTSQRPILLHN